MKAPNNFLSLSAQVSTFSRSSYPEGWGLKGQPYKRNLLLRRDLSDVKLGQAEN